MKKLYAILSLSLLLISCSSKSENKLILKSSTGRINSILVVVDNSKWDGKVGKALKNVFTGTVAGLPQPESHFRVSQISPNNFNDMFENNRNILVIGTGTKNNYSVIKNKYAEPQIIMGIIGKDESNLIAQIKLHKKDIYRVFKKSDLNLYQRKLAKSVWPQNKFKQLENKRINIPKNYMVVENTKEFLWLRKHLTKDGTLNILAYTLPLKNKDSISLISLLKARNKIGKMHIPGQFDNTYMQVSLGIQPRFKKVLINNTQAYEIRGLWEVKNDFMGGPFINYTFVDSANNRLICLDGFVYAPNQDKRDYIFELEAIIKTLKLK